MDLHHWVSEGLMALFFLVVGIEIKREFVRGQLGSLRAASLPIGAAVGGMLLPALLFLMLNYDQPANRSGWAIPIATDIAFALGVMSLLGKRVPASLKLFLLTLAVVDDIGAIIIIAVFYNSQLAVVPLLAALAIGLLIAVGSKTRLLTLPVFVLLGMLTWVAVYKSGIHASITGALLGFLAPLSAKSTHTIAERLERYAIPLATLVVVPLFAFASLGINLSGFSLAEQNSGRLALGIVAGLTVGKVLGVTLAAWLLIRFKLASLPARSTWLQLIGTGFLTGVGFTVSIFITEIAFETQPALTLTAKVSILFASCLSAAIGYLFLRHRRRVQEIIDAV